jgi:CDP-glycerol glycerophosphotransferase
MLETAAYLINDTTFPFRYVKRDGQIYLNTWHGTPYKKMGNDKHEGRHLIDNIQRNLMQADYLLFPSRYCEERMTEAHCIQDM